MIDITNLTKDIHKKNIIIDFSFNAQPKECIGLVGHDSVVKTTLIKLLSGSIPPSTGHIKIGGFDIVSYPREAKHITGYQPQSLAGHRTMTVNGFLNFIAAIRGFSGIEKRKRIDRVVARLELSHTLKCPLEMLPKGLKRKIAIAQAILHTPGLLLLDNPTEGLEPDQKNKIGTLIKSLNEEMTVVIASECQKELTSICKRALVIASGRLLADLPFTELQRKSRHYQAITLSADGALDLLALAVLPGVAGIEENRQLPGTVTILAMPGQTIYGHVNALIANRGWKINSLSLELGRLDDVVNHLSQEASI